MTSAELSEFQAAFARGLLAPHPADTPPPLDASTVDRFRIYRNNYTHGMLRELSAAFPVVRRLVGPRFFDAMGRAWLVAHPPRTRSLALFGAGFAKFVDRFEPARAVPYLGDVARLERARLEALHEADAPTLDPARLASMGENLAEASFLAHPATRLVLSPHPIVGIWQANQDKRPRGPIAGRAEAALITRPELALRMAALDAPEARFARALLTGATASAAYDAAVSVAPAFDPIAAWRTLLTSGALTTNVSGGGDGDAAQ